MGYTRDLLEGLKAELSAGGVTDFVRFGPLPTTPDRAIGISPYSPVDEPKVSRTRLRMQFRFRGIPNDSLDCDDLADAVFGILHGLEDRTYGAVHLIQCFRVSSLPGDADSSKRTERTDNYELDLDLPLTPGRPW